MSNGNKLKQHAASAAPSVRKLSSLKIVTRFALTLGAAVALMYLATQSDTTVASPANAAEAGKVSDRAFLPTFENKTKPQGRTHRTIPPSRPTPGKSS